MSRGPRAEEQPSRPQVLLEVAQDLVLTASRTVRNTLGLLLLSLIISIALWVFVTESENPTRVDILPAEVPVEAVNLADQLAVANQLSSVELRLSAPEDRWDQLTASNFRAYVDLNGLDQREQRVPVQVETRGVSGVRVLGTVPATILVNLEEMVSREVPVEPRLQGTLPRGYELASVAVSQQTTEVSGPASLVSLVATAAADVNITGLTVGVEEGAELIPVGEAGGEIRGVSLEPQTVEVTIDVQQTLLTRTLPVDVELVGEPAPGYRIAGVTVTPASIAVNGPIDVLQGLDGLTLRDVSVDGLEGDLETTLRVPAPPGSVLRDDGAVSVLVDIEPIVGSMRVPVAPEVVDVAPGLTATVETPSVSVLLEGPVAALDELAAAGLQATVSAAGLGEGVHSLPVQVQAPPDIVVTVQPPEVSVTLNVP